jgi:hypothetical protein
MDQIFCFLRIPNRSNMVLITRVGLGSRAILLGLACEIWSPLGLQQLIQCARARSRYELVRHLQDWVPI